MEIAAAAAAVSPHLSQNVIDPRQKERKGMEKGGGDRNERKGTEWQNFGQRDESCNDDAEDDYICNVYDAVPAMALLSFLPSFFRLPCCFLCPIAIAFVTAT